MPWTAPDEKEDRTRNWGATVVRFGDNYSEAVELAKERYAGDPRTDIPSYDHEDVIDGQGTAGLEILEQCPDVTHIFVPGGGGGYSAGILKAVKALKPEVKVIIVEPEDSNAIQLGYIAGKPVELPRPPSRHADGVAVKQAGEVTLPYILALADGVITVNRDQIDTAVTSFFTEKKRVLEPSGALSMAGADKYAALTGCEGQTFVTLASGSDISAGKAGEILRRGEELTGHEALFSVQIPEKPGTLHRLTGEVVGRQRNITELTYSRDDPETAVIQIGFSMENADDRHRFARQTQEQGYVSVDHTDDEDFKDYERGIVRRSPEPRAELSYVIDLPERAGALVDLLDALGDKWDICEIIYTTHRSETGSPRISFAATDREELETGLQQTGCSFRAVESARR
jgi:threonine dehydratase